jgi:translation initiation factor IF-2
LKLSTLETEIIIIHTWVWAITEWDILMSQWNGSILVWFWVWVLPTAKSILENSWTEFIASDIIYHITERIEKIITWMLDLKEIEVKLWRSKVGWVFYTDKKFMILGLLVPAESKVENNALARILRQKRMIWTWKIESLKEWKIEVKEVEWPNECWIKFVSNAKVEVWDELEIYKIEKQK